MKEDWLELVACPVCQNELGFNGGSDSSLVCQACGGRYSFRDQIPLLVAPAESDGLAEFGRVYTRRRLKKGWLPIPGEQALKLPFVRPAGYPRIYWEVRQQSFTTLKNILCEHGPFPSMGPVAELGAGNGWLSYRLAESGFRVVALDVNIDEIFGLGAAQIYLTHADFTLVQGDLNRLPLPENRFSLVIFNASLHYAKDLSTTLRRAREALLPEGRIVILDSPISKSARPGSVIGDRQLGQGELDQQFTIAGLFAHWLPVQRGAKWWLTQVLRFASGKLSISMPIIVAGRAQEV